MKSLLFLSLIASMSLGSALAEAPVDAGVFYTLWYDMPKDSSAQGGSGKAAKRSWVKVGEVKGDWAKVTLYDSKAAARTSFALDQIEKDTPVSQSFVAAQNMSRDELLKLAREDLKKRPAPRIMWVNLTQVLAIHEMEMKEPEPKKEEK